jgi:hypothetical protein
MLNLLIILHKNNALHNKKSLVSTSSMHHLLRLVKAWILPQDEFKKVYDEELENSVYAYLMKQKKENDGTHFIYN